MNPTVMGTIAFGCTFGGVLLGMWLHTVLPPRHLEPASRDTVNVGIALIATMTALVLGLITASAKTSFDEADTAVKRTAVNILTLDRVLARYGPETAAIRSNLRRAIAARIDVIWPHGTVNRAELDPMRSGAGAEAEGLAAALRSLEPRDDAQRALRSRAQQLTESLLEARWLVLSGGSNSIPAPFLAIVLFWLTITFVSFGLFAPRNGTVLAVLFVCAVSVGSAVFLVLELDGPFDGVLRIPPDSLRYAYAHLNQ